MTTRRGYAGRAAATREKIRGELWDETARHLRQPHTDGRFVRSLGATSFYPLAAGAANADQAASLLDHLHDPATFGGRYVVPSVSRDDPAFADNTYWRGRIWPPLNYLDLAGPAPLPPGRRGDAAGGS